MIRQIFVLTIMIIGAVVASSAQTGTKTEALVWHTDAMKANELSKKSNKPIFGFFTGSDWCGWCKKLQREVFAKPEFVEWAKKNVVLLELDFPRNKKLPDELMQQNYGLQQAFNVQGYPTIWVFTLNKDATTGKFNISAYGQLSYPRGAIPGKEEVKFIEDANLVLANKPK